MTSSYTTEKEPELVATRRALRAIRNPEIRDDLCHFISGAETCLRAQEIHLALDAVRSVVCAVVALNRTISSEVAVRILDGLLEDSEKGAVALRRGLGFTKNKNEKCDIKSGTPIGSSSCVSSPNSTCYTFSGGSGCGGTSGFQFVWESRYAAID